MLSPVVQNAKDLPGYSLVEHQFVIENFPQHPISLSDGVEYEVVKTVVVVKERGDKVVQDSVTFVHYVRAFVDLVRVVKN